MGQTSGWFYSPECGISPFTRCHQNPCTEPAACMEFMKKIVIREAVQQPEIHHLTMSEEWGKALVVLILGREKK